MEDKIVIKGACEHNLKNISISLSKNNLIVFTGISGSGKSSLAFDTIYAEGQRRYVESLSSYARQFLGIMDKPDVDSIDGLSPAISIDQKSTSANPRSTVGTITEVYDYLRLLFARIGHPHCSSCGREIVRQSIKQIVDNVVKLFVKLFLHHHRKPTRFLILSPVIRDKKGEFKELFRHLSSKGFTKVRIDGKIFGLDEDLTLIKTNKHTIDVVIDRITIEKGQLVGKNASSKLRFRISDSIEQALSLSEGLVIISEVEDSSFNFPEKPVKFSDNLFSEHFACPRCNISIPEIEPRVFSFNSPHGACSKCSGLGKLLRVNPSLVINKNLSINEGGILPFARLILSDTWYGRVLLTVVETIGIDPGLPLKKASAQNLEKLLYGTGDKIYEVSGRNRHGRIVTICEKFSGIIPNLERRFSQTDSEIVRKEISKYLREEVCPECHGQRLKKEALSITVGDKTIIDITRFSILTARDFINKLEKQLTSREKIIANLIIKEIRNRLNFLLSVGLNYLTLDRSANTLAGGEAQRIRLASQIGSGLSGVLYVLDEPSIGLHPRDNNRLIRTLKNLRDLGNTVIVVEHDREMIESADLIVDFGPSAGKHGGEIIVSGSPLKVKKSKKSLTGLYLSNRKNLVSPSECRVLFPKQMEN